MMDVQGRGLRMVETRRMFVKDSMLVIGFPTFGLVGSVAASYLVHAMDMKLIGHMLSDEFPPVVVMENGVVEMPVRVYATQVVCGVDNKCNQLVVVLSDIQPPVEMLNPMAEVILNWAEEREVSLVVALEGHPFRDDSMTDAKLVAMANKSATSIFDRYGFAKANGMVTGFTGALLLSSVERKIPVLSLVTQAHKDYPDANAAAMLLEALNPLVPLMLIDTKPLREKAVQIENEMRKNLEVQKTSLRNLTQEPGGEMYR
jgi:uncharacterized protein